MSIFLFQQFGTSILVRPSEQDESGFSVMEIQSIGRLHKVLINGGSTIIITLINQLKKHMLSLKRKVHKRVFMSPIFIGKRHHPWGSSIIPSLAPKERQRRHPFKMWQMQIGWDKLNVTNAYRQKKINCLLNKWAIKMIACCRNTLSSAAACRGTSVWSPQCTWTPAFPNPAVPLRWNVWNARGFYDTTAGNRSLDEGF